MTIKQAKIKFLSRVKKLSGKDACWEWQGFCDNQGYGHRGGHIIKFLGVGTLVHRQSYKLFKGEIPYGLHILHKCDNPPCVNPNHLWLGTQADNVEDMYQKGRANPATGDRNISRLCPELRRGSNNGNAKVNSIIVRCIRRYYIAGKPNNIGSGNSKELAEQFGITPSAVRNIAARRKWSHIK